MRATIAAWLLMAATSACASHSQRAAPRVMHDETSDAADRRFDRVAEAFLDDYFRLEPVAATAAGEHRYDGRWPDRSEAGDAAARAAIDKALTALAVLPAASLGTRARVDREVLENQARYWRFALDQLREAERNPVAYTSLWGEGLDPLLTRAFAAGPERAARAAERLSGIPAMVAVAERRLGRPPALHTETATRQNEGLVALCEGGLGALEAEAGAGREPLARAAREAAVALREFGRFLRGELASRSDGEARLGRALYEQKLRFELDDPVDIDALRREASALVASTQDEMAVTAAELWPSLFPTMPAPPSRTRDEKKALTRSVLARLADEHPSDATIVGDASRLLAEATAFVRDRDLVRVPVEPCRVVEMPEYRRGVAVAYCDSSGPLERHPETQFAISPAPRDWPPARVASYYREYNSAMLADLTVHEAMPGHYLQLMHNNAFRSKLRAVFSSGAFVEGWAVYAEWLMAHHGFGGPRVRLQRQKMVLRSAVNALLDHDTHAGTLDESAALALMTGEAFQEEGEAVGKWRRARLTSAQLSTYFYGFRAMMRLRARAETAPDFRERSFHDTLLGFGSPPPRLVAGLLFGT